MDAIAIGILIAEVLTGICVNFVDKKVDKLRELSTTNTRLWFAWYETKPALRKFLILATVIILFLFLWRKIKSIYDTLFLEIYIQIHGHVQQFDLVLGAAISALFGLLVQWYARKQDSRIQIQKSATLLFYDLNTAKSSIESFKFFMEQPNDENSLKALVLQQPLNFDRNWRQHCVQLLHIISSQHYTKISELYYYLEKSVKCISEQDMVSLRNAVYAFLGQYYRTETIMLKLSTTEILEDLQRLSAGRKVRRRLLSTLKYEITYYRKKKLMFQDAETSIFEYLLQHGTTKLDVLKKAIFSELNNKLPHFLVETLIFERFIFDVVMDSKIIKCVWNECRLTSGE